ncbi:MULTISPECIES: hypothetical protein [Paraburkholderia]|uniref:hypothetical protein n=1 Tax=Paraburkholderia TaxID=1822464 RepID=UPI00117CD7C6
MELSCSRKTPALERSLLTLTNHAPDPYVHENDVHAKTSLNETLDSPMILLVGVVLMLGLVNANPVARLAFTACSATKTTVAFSFLAVVLIDGFLRRSAGPGRGTNDPWLRTSGIHCRNRIDMAERP